jgi:predicted enzyme related to lactoylglutathione lyase
LNEEKMQTVKSKIMSTKTKAKTKTNKSLNMNVPASLVWFEIPADDLKRAQKFYSGLFGWKINPFPNMPDYWHIDTGGADASPDGAIMKKMCPEHPVTNYIQVDSVTRASAKVEKLGGKVHKAKTAVPQMGYFAICQDTENNVFALWERSESAK